MHLMADEVQKAAGVPLLHIADPLGEAAKKAGMKKLGLIGTRFTMDEPRIIADRLRQKFGLEVILPDAAGRETIDSIIQTELVKGVIRDESRARYRAVMAKLVEQGAEAIILGCTEIPLLVSQADAPACRSTTRCSCMPRRSWILRWPEIRDITRPSDGRVTAAAQECRGKSGLHGKTVPVNGRRGRPQG